MTAKCGETVNILRVAAPKRKKKHAVTLMTIGIESQGSSEGNRPNDGSRIK